MITLVDADEDCPPYTIRDEAEADSACLEKVCEDKKIVDYTGRCVLCPPYQVKESNKACGFPNCPTNKIISTSGECSLCPDGQ